MKETVDPEDRLLFEDMAEEDSTRPSTEATGSWLRFMEYGDGGSMGSILLDMLMKYNHGVPLGKQKSNWSALLWLAAVILYFLISFTFGHWHLTWMIFLVATILQILIGSGGNKNS